MVKILFESSILISKRVTLNRSLERCPEGKRPPSENHSRKGPSRAFDFAHPVDSYFQTQQVKISESLIFLGAIDAELKGAATHHVALKALDRLESLLN